MHKELLDYIIKETRLIAILPRNKKYAVSTREIGITLGIPQTTIYRRIAPLQKWSNMGIIEKPREYRGGAPEQFYYLLHDYTIKFKQRKTSIIYRK